MIEVTLELLKELYNLVSAVGTFILVLYAGWIIAWDYPKLKDRVKKLENEKSNRS